MTFTATPVYVQAGKAENYTTVTVRLNITSYTTGGEALTSTLTPYLPNSIVGCTAAVSNESGKNQILVWDQDNKKLMAYNAADGDQVNAATDIGEHIVTFIGY